MQFQKRQQFIIGSRHADHYSYEDVVGYKALYLEPKTGYAHCHRVDTDRGIWYVHEDDMHPVGVNNEELAHLLRRD